MLKSETHTVTDPNGLVWCAGGAETDDHLSHGGHETALVQIAKGLLPDNGVFLDVGAHVGLYTLNLADKASRVYAIEANPKTFKVLSENIAMNRTSVHSQIEAVNLAAWDSFTTLGLVDANDKETGGSTRCVDSDDGEVQAVPLDSLFRDVRIDFVKCDVEGAEFRVLQGMTEVIEHNHPTFLIEMHDKVYDLPGLRDNVIGFLESHGYDWDDSLTHGDECYYMLAQYGKEYAPVEVVHLDHEPGGYGKFIDMGAIQSAISNYKEHR